MDIPTPQEICVKYPASQMCILLALPPQNKKGIVQAWRMNLCEAHAEPYILENIAYAGQQVASFNLDPKFNWCQMCYAIELGQRRWPLAQVASNIVPWRNVEAG